MGRRAGGVALFAASIFAFATTSAWACEDAPPQSATAAAGDSVAFELPGTSEGARYTLTIDGGEVHSGTDGDSEPGVRDSFAIPDLGPDKREVTVAIAVEEKDGSDCSGTLSVDYRGRRAADPPPPTAPPPGPGDATAPASPPSQAGTVAPASPAPGLGAADRSNRAGRGSGDDGEGRSAVKGVTRTLANLAPALRRATTPRSRKARRAKSRKRRKARKHARKLIALADAGPDAPRPTPPDVSREKADLSGGGFPGLGYRVAWQLLLAAALAGLVLMGLVGARVRLRRRHAC